MILKVYPCYVIMLPDNDISNSIPQTCVKKHMIPKYEIQLIPFCQSINLTKRIRPLQLGSYVDIGSKQRNMSIDNLKVIHVTSLCSQRNGISISILRTLCQETYDSKIYELLPMRCAKLP